MPDRGVRLAVSISAMLLRHLLAERVEVRHVDGDAGSLHRGQDRDQRQLDLAEQRLQAGVLQVLVEHRDQPTEDRGLVAGVLADLLDREPVHRRRRAPGARAGCCRPASRPGACSRPGRAGRTPAGSTPAGKRRSSSRTPGPRSRRRGGPARSGGTWRCAPTSRCCASPRTGASRSRTVGQSSCWSGSSATWPTGMYQAASGPVARPTPTMSARIGCEAGGLDVERDGLRGLQLLHDGV